ncbi:hypothetical protein POVWA2_021510 [Plasmodium ovale wallikeri]|uniref:Uncharacterized protein n=1 Tax=Plasmodium ovale wallikeri TaxID=864142 RepID=A0A1A8YT82_PLAOA|nr:hypothetical protein POVWA1_021530 [Plasmodium ovale wallikeri]SBT34743.1 hypothetical protein POVWA2_021510 [Plasmodium ovale wallikeri]
MGKSESECNTVEEKRMNEGGGKKGGVTEGGGKKGGVTEGGGKKGGVTEGGGKKEGITERVMGLPQMSRRAFYRNGAKTHNNNLPSLRMAFTHLRCTHIHVHLGHVCLWNCLIVYTL